jgi:hypothetical protein
MKKFFASLLRDRWLKFCFKQNLNSGDPSPHDSGLRMPEMASGIFLQKIPELISGT